ncbi:hypothetical protein EDC04DRAFT_2901010 [Pisolithus marmoratus]|nr:hypothetical protein EDC04DRAFT_2901010 [Pisolithus marmoratus]
MIQIWNIENRGDRKPLMNSGVAVNVIASSKDGNFIVTGGVDGKVMIWDTSLQKICEASERHGKVITALDVSSLHVASGSNDGTVRVWKLGALGFPAVPAPLMRHGSISVSSVKLSPTGRHIASASARWDCSVKIWHTQTWAHIASIPIRPPTHSLAWSSDGGRLFAGCANGSISYLDAVTRKAFSKVVEPRPGDDSITSLRVSNSDQLLVSFSAPGRTVDIWDIRETPANEPLRSYRRCVSASMSPDDLYLASTGDDMKISIRSLSGVTELSYFFHCLPPFLSHSEPLTYISPTAYRNWKLGELEQVEHILSREIEDKRYQYFTCYARANRALVRIRRGNLNGALDDTEAIMTNGAQIPPIAHIAKAIALIRQGKQRDAMDAFGSADFGGAKDFVECVKSVILFQVELDKINCETELAELSPLEDACSCPWVKTCKSLLLAEHCVQRGECNEGQRLLAEAPDLGQIPEAKILPLIFGWDIYDLEHRVQEVTCQALFASGRTQEVRDFIRVNENRLDEENEVRKADLGGHAEKLGDEAMCHKQYDDAITWYSFSLDLFPESRVIDRGSEFAMECLAASDVADAAVAKDLTLTPGSARLLVKRSKAKAFKEFWNEALEDADQAINMDNLCPWGYERRYVALHALQRYEEATETFSKMVTKMKESAEPSIRELSMKYVKTIENIDKQIDVISKKYPFVLIDVRTGKLCNAVERIRIFKMDPTFHELVSSMSAELDTDRIKKVVARYFRYVMFSHTWEGKEPTFQDVSEKSVYEPDPDPHGLRLKLRHFCETARDDREGYLWAWSDTCCIDKDNPAVYDDSIRSMYSWYEKSALTIVVLACGPMPSTLKNNKWMTRAWTLQELLAPKSIRFYSRNWALYRGDTWPNHKESPDIRRELAQAVGIDEDTLVDFSPISLDVRAKLRLASTREATVPVDIANALFGIFSSDLTPERRDPENALGLLLQEIVHRERDAKAVLDWVGKSSQFNSCLPAEISAYQDPPYKPPPIRGNEMEARVVELRALLPPQDVMMFFEDLCALGSISFTHRRLSLPCITFSVLGDAIRCNEASSASSSRITYQAQSSTLGHFEFKTSCTAFMDQDEVVLVYPWIRDLLAQTDLPGCDKYNMALRLVVHLEQPFRALLLVKRSFDTYKRVAVDNEILIPQWKVTSLQDIVAKVLDIR